MRARSCTLRATLRKPTVNFHSPFHQHHQKRTPPRRAHNAHSLQNVHGPETVKKNFYEHVCDINLDTLAFSSERAAHNRMNSFAINFLFLQRLNVNSTCIGMF